MKSLRQYANVCGTEINALATLKALWLIRTSKVRYLIVLSLFKDQMIETSRIRMSDLVKASLKISIEKGSLAFFFRLRRGNVIIPNPMSWISLFLSTAVFPPLELCNSYSDWYTIYIIFNIKELQNYTHKKWFYKSKLKVFLQ